MVIKISIAFIIAVYLLMYLHQYIEVPQFMILFALGLLLAFYFSWKENSDYQKAIDANPYDFRIQKTEKNTTKDNAIGFGLFILVLALPYFFEFPFEHRDDLDDLISYQIFLFFAGLFIVFTQPNFNYYHFGTRYITLPGPEQKPLRWSEIKVIETHEGIQTFYFYLKEGSKIEFDLKHYYSDRKWEEVMDYFAERGVKMVPVKGKTFQ